MIGILPDLPVVARVAVDEASDSAHRRFLANRKRKV